MKELTISKRLEEIARLIPKCYSFADIGTDHGLLAIYAIKNKIAKRVYACDIAKKPLKQARTQIENACLTKEIELRLGSGLEPIKDEVLEGIVIAGMGGSSIYNILEENRESAQNYNFMVLQAQNNQQRVRKWLFDNGFNIKIEVLVLENGFIYQIIKAVAGKSSSYSELELEYGKVDLVNDLGLYIERIKNDIKHYKKIIKQMPIKNNHAIMKERNRFIRKAEMLERCISKLG